MKIITVEQLGLAIQNYFKIEDIKVKKRTHELVEIRRIMYYIAKYRLTNITMQSVATWLNQGHGIESFHANKVHQRILQGDGELEIQVNEIFKILGTSKRKINLQRKYNFLFEAHEKLKQTNKSIRTELLLEKQLTKQLKNELASLKFSLLKTA